jgi:hypothetical protein
MFSVSATFFTFRLFANLQIAHARSSIGPATTTNGSVAMGYQKIQGGQKGIKQVRVVILEGVLGES